MTQGDRTELLAEWVQDALEREQRALHTLDSIIATTGHVEFRGHLERHRMETAQHAERLSARLEALGGSTSALKEAQGLFSAAVEAFTGELREDQVRQNVRDLYGSEQTSIATYQLLERLAVRAGDEETALVARENRAEDEAMVALIDVNWDAFVEIALAEPA